MAISGARRAGQAGGSLPSYDQPQGLGRVCVCPHLRPEGEESRPYARLRVRSPTPLVGSGWVFALQDGLLNGIVRITGWSAKGRLTPKAGAQKNQSGPYRASDCAGSHVSSLLPATPLLPEMADTVDRTSVAYPRSRALLATCAVAWATHKRCERLSSTERKSLHSMPHTCGSHRSVSSALGRT